ncbi:zinc-dependent alcohol dehydrogenase [Alkalicoccobacillus gibsonii]|uniref:zinc-dependent alcohol dehydrogenase n=1 Tax=Alkalicoccobacillus gibsonii TaxID=79881 RepID=UPI003514111C
MKAIVYERAQSVTIKEKKLGVNSGSVRIKTAYAGICGTDLNIFAGTHPRAQENLTMGHEFSGIIESGHPSLPTGTKVTVNPLLSCGTCIPCTTGNPHVCETLKLIGIDCDGGMARSVDVPVKNVVTLPEQMPLKVGALAEPVAVAVHAIRQGGYTPGDRVLVFGAGTIGLCLALTLKATGASKVVIVETNPLRIQKAKELGFSAINPTETSVIDFVTTETNGSGYDCVFDCAGHPAVLADVMESVKVRGKVVIIAGYKKPAEVNLLKGMFKELSIQFVRVYTDKDFQIALDLLMQHDQYQKIITHVLPPEDAAKGFELLIKPSDAVKVLFDFTGEE